MTSPRKKATKTRKKATKTRKKATKTESTARKEWPRRKKRYVSTPNGNDQREHYQRDRDRILYSSAFRRLGGVTQVVGISEGFHFHNRLLHSLKVAQIARRIVEGLYLQDKQRAADFDLQPEVAEAAALAHDLGHPPFGHIADTRICKLVDDHWEGDNPGGFEGNAQSFRVVTTISRRCTDHEGLNLTGATLAAILKYPWTRTTAEENEYRNEKWGAYETEAGQLRCASDATKEQGNLHAGVTLERAAEAEIMDWADDIAYSVHDLEDFWKAGLIPLERLADEPRILEEFLDATEQHWSRSSSGQGMTRSKIIDTAQKLLYHLPTTMREPYVGRNRQRAEARNFTSFLIGRYVRDAVALTCQGSNALLIEKNAREEVLFLKTLTRFFVILNPALAAQQRGFRKVIDDLFEFFLEIASLPQTTYAIPPRYQTRLRDPGIDNNTRLRVVADLVSGLTEWEALDLHKRLTGIEAGSVLDPIIR